MSQKIFVGLAALVLGLGAGFSTGWVTKKPQIIEVEKDILVGLPPEPVLGEPDLGATNYRGVNTFSVANNNSTTTADTKVPTQILPREPNRSYALIVNDSATVLYLTLANFDDPTAASTTVGLDGIRLNANGGSYEINNNNLYTGEVWASSTAGSLKIVFATSTQ